MSDSPLAVPLPWDLVATAYEAEVRPPFEIYAREALRLQLADSSGAAVSIRELHIRQATDQESSESGLVLEVETSDPMIWSRRP